MEFLACFERSHNGTWTCRTPVTLHHPKGRIQVSTGTSFAPGTSFMGVDVALWLDEHAARRIEPHKKPVEEKK
jgi:hypothetical protein